MSALSQDTRTMLARTMLAGTMLARLSVQGISNNKLKKWFGWIDNLSHGIGSPAAPGLVAPTWSTLDTLIPDLRLGSGKY